MSRYVVEIAPLAERDLRDAILWYRERSALAADAFRVEAFDAIEKIGKAPLGKAADDEGNRRRVLHRFPYSVVYEVLESAVTNLAVTHRRRGPGYGREGRG